MRATYIGKHFDAPLMHPGMTGTLSTCHMRGLCFVPDGWPARFHAVRPNEIYVSAKAQQESGGDFPALIDALSDARYACDNQRVRTLGVEPAAAQMGYGVKNLPDYIPEIIARIDRRIYASVPCKSEILHAS